MRNYTEIPFLTNHRAECAEGAGPYDAGWGYRVYGLYSIGFGGCERISFSYSSPARNGHGHLVGRSYEMPNDRVAYYLDKMRGIANDQRRPPNTGEQDQ